MALLFLLFLPPPPTSRQTSMHTHTMKATDARFFSLLVMFYSCHLLKQLAAAEDVAQKHAHAHNDNGCNHTSRSNPRRLHIAHQCIRMR